MSKPAPAAAAGKPAPAAAATKAVHHVKIADDEAAAHEHGKGAGVKKVLTGRYNMQQLKLITEFDSFCDEELAKMYPKGGAPDIDFDEFDAAPDKKKFLEGKLTTAPAATKGKFVDEYIKRAAKVQEIIHSAALQRTGSGAKLT